MLARVAIAAVCRRWTAADPVRVEPLGATGFSGSRVFSVALADPPGRFVLKRFHAAATVEHARFVHGLVRHLRAEGILQVPEVLAALDGDTVVAADGGLWELARLMPGAAVACPTAAQAAAAADMLARVHLAAARLPGHPPRTAISPGVERRIEQARRLLAEPWEARRADWMRAGRPAAAPRLTAAVVERLERAIAGVQEWGGDTLLTRCAALPSHAVMIQPVLRDIWYEHVLCADAASDSVTGLIDLHAAGIDTPATDLARLMGSWQLPADGARLSLVARWPEAVAAYERVRPLSREEVGLIPFLHATGLLFGLDNWFRWTLDEQREFPDADRVLARIDSLLEALPAGLANARSGQRL
ncbi:MAG: phosphotransferase enzyme family protein [Planctomycetia bacterium]